MSEVQKAPPALFQHCRTVFDTMKAEASPQQIETPGNEKRHAFVWHGHTTKLFRRLNLPSPYYTSILTSLQQMGCIKQLSRGGGSAESRWELVDDPTMDLFFEAAGVSTDKKSRLSIVEARIQKLEERLEETGS